MINKYLTALFVLLKKNLALLLILLVVALVHLYKSQNLFFWQVDEDIVGLTIKRILVDHHPQLIGFPFPGGIYPGPAVYYILSIPYIISAMNPSGLPIVSALIATLTTFLVFYCGKEIFKDLKTGLFASIIFGFSFLPNVYSRFLNGLTFAPILALLAYLILVKIIEQRKPVNIFFLGLMLVLSVQNEGSSISILILVLAVFVIFKIRFHLKHFLILSSIFFLFHLPLVIFELRHNFVLSDKLLQFATKGSGGFSSLAFLGNLISNLFVFPAAFLKLIFPTGKFDVVEQIFPCFGFSDTRLIGHPFLLVIIFFFLIAACYRFLIGKNLGGKLVAIHFFILIFGLGLYSLFIGSYKYEWITAIFFPGFSLILGFYLSKVSKISNISKGLVFVFIFIFLVLNLRATFSTKGRFGLKDKTMAVQYAISKVGNRSFFLDSIGSCYEQGYNYLFWYYKHPPTYVKNLIIDPLLIGQTGETTTQIGIVIIAHSEKNELEFYQKYTEYKNRAKDQKMIGNIEVLTIEN